MKKRHIMQGQELDKGIVFSYSFGSFLLVGNPPQNIRNSSKASFMMKIDNLTKERGC